jgi:hypothetical protein
MRALSTQDALLSPGAHHTWIQYFYYPPASKAERFIWLHPGFPAFEFFVFDPSSQFLSIDPDMAA